MHTCPYRLYIQKTVTHLALRLFSLQQVLFHEMRSLILQICEKFHIYETYKKNMERIHEKVMFFKSSHDRSF